MNNYPTPLDQQLIKALNSLKTPKEIQSFLRDLLTLPEINEASNRFHIATLLWTTDKSYLEIANQCQTSTTTVTRVNDWLYNQGLNGYQTALKRLYGSSKR